MRVLIIGPHLERQVHGQGEHRPLRGGRNPLHRGGVSIGGGDRGIGHRLGGTRPDVDSGLDLAHGGPGTAGGLVKPAKSALQVGFPDACQEAEGIHGVG